MVASLPENLGARDDLLHRNAVAFAYRSSLQKSLSIDIAFMWGLVCAHDVAKRRFPFRRLCCSLLNCRDKCENVRDFLLKLRDLRVTHLQPSQLRERTYIYLWVCH